MAYQFPQDVQQSLTAWVASGKYASEDDVLRDALRALTDEQDDDNAVQEALAELEHGDVGVPLCQAFDEVRTKHGIPPRKS
jgi:Arc/MetJ-type ribon-helix-helix transcriptional regulator